MYHLWPCHWPSHFIFIVCLDFGVNKRKFFLYKHISFFPNHLQQPFTKKSLNSWKIPFLFIMKVDINFSNGFDIILTSCYYYLCEYIKGFMNNSGNITKFCFKIWLNYSFFRLFWKCTICDLDIDLHIYIHHLFRFWSQ